MKTFILPLIDHTFHIYVGETEWTKFYDASKKEGAQDPWDKRTFDPKRLRPGSGRHYGGHVWLYDLDERGVIFHELSHLLDTIMSFVGTDDSEFRAYLTEWVFEKVLKWVERQAGQKTDRETGGSE